jgi:hypothetical protein
MVLFILLSLLPPLGPIFFVLDFCVLSPVEMMYKKSSNYRMEGRKTHTSPIHPFLELIMSVASLKFKNFLNIFFSSHLKCIVMEILNLELLNPHWKLRYKNRGK